MKPDAAAQPAAGAAPYQLDAGDREGLTAYLQRHGLLAPGEHVLTAARAGEGNMNLTLRVTTETRSLIVKQGRPWVEKYPQIPAPVERTIVEGRFYALAERSPPLAARMPRLLALDPQSHILVLQDLGKAGDLTSLYAGARLGEAAVAELADYLGHLHELPVPAAELPVLRNPAMRALNHEHIFRFPLDPHNGLNLDAITPGLTALARELAGDPAYVERVHRLGQLYLEATAGSLCHGDFFPGSFLGTESGIFIIDPEFCFLGPREFDLGVLLAHLHLAGQPAPAGEDLLRRYEQRAAVDRELVRALTGVEIMRRLIGVAQLPLNLDLDGKRQLLALSRRLVLGL
ncbi:MAG TPA: phosphotransferase [Pseudomonadota bacterium]|nr:phosphotransferase [Pseudomonadota bacterium]